MPISHMRLPLIICAVVAAVLSYFILSIDKLLLAFAGGAAKLTCSSYFVGRLSLDVIKSHELNQPVSHPSLYALLQDVKVDEEEKRIVARIGWRYAEAKYHGDKLGCSLIIPLGSKLPQSYFKLENTPRWSPPEIDLPVHYDPELTALVSREVYPGATDEALVETFKRDNGGREPSAVEVEALKRASLEYLKKSRTRAIVILQHGEIVAEGYDTSGQGITKNTPLPGWSMTKSVLAALVGVRVKQGKLNLDHPAALPEWTEEQRKKANITIRNFINMNSGLDNKEEYIMKTSVGQVVQMIFAERSTSIYAHKGKGQVNATGSTFYYSSASSNLLSEELRSTFNGSNKDYWTFPFVELFHKMGASSFVLETDPAGTFVGSSFSLATARDWAKFGQLHIQDGVWAGKRILPEGWVKFVTTPTVHPSYGAHFWLGPAAHKPWTSVVPADAYRCDGYEFQTVTIIPSLDAVIVRLGNTPKDKDFDAMNFFQQAVKVLKSRK